MHPRVKFPEADSHQYIYADSFREYADHFLLNKVDERKKNAIIRKGR